MNFAVKIIVLLLLVVGIFGRSILQDGSSNFTETTALTLPSEAGTACELNGVFHPLDSTFSPPGSPCLVCECNENWTGEIGNSTCYEEECVDEDNSKLSEGCIPVYDERKCCVIDFYCRDNVIPDAAEEIENDNATEGNDEVICPTPLCADESCRIETPPGHLCPTCICEGFKEKNEYEPAGQLSERHPLEVQNATEDMEFFLIPVPWSGVQQEENESTDEGAEMAKPETMEQVDREDVSSNMIQVVMKEELEPRRKRSTNTQTASNTQTSQQQQQQQRWTILQEDMQLTSDSDERERENSEDSSDDYGDMKIFGQKESDSTHNQITDMDDEESVVWEKTGCPTPLCEHSGCRIGIPPGHKCPTCICSRIRQP